MPGNYSVNSRAVGELLTASKYNSDHAVHRDHMTPDGVDDHSVNTTQMHATTNPGTEGSETFATSIGGEIERLRYVISEIKQAPWYATSWGVHDRDAVPRAVSSATLTPLYSLGINNLHGTQSGIELRTIFTVLNQSSITPCYIGMEVLYGGQLLFTQDWLVPASSTPYTFLVRAYMLARNNTNVQWGAVEIEAYPGADYRFLVTPALTVNSTVVQNVVMQVHSVVSDPALVITHVHTQLWRR